MTRPTSATGRLARYGFDDFVLLAGYRAEAVEEFAVSGVPVFEGTEPRIRVLTESRPLGTAGALKNAGNALAAQFLMLNGDCLFDVNFLDLTVPRNDSNWLARLALRQVGDASRYGVVALSGSGLITDMKDRPDGPGPGLINGGIYWMRREILEAIPDGECSIEQTIFPDLARRGLLRGSVYDGVFLDIGVPDDYARSQQLVPDRRRRPAVFFDRDGVLNHDAGYTHRIEEFRWIDGAREAIRLVNDAGWFAFVVTNQAGVARGLYDEADVQRLHRWMNDDLRNGGAHIDAFRYCPYHVDGVVDRYARPSDWRKPEPGMLLDLAECWPVDMTRSVLIGDKVSDIEAAQKAGIAAIKYEGGDVGALVAKALA